MASGHVNRTQRPNTWLHRPACNVKYPLPTRSRPHMALSGPQGMSQVSPEIEPKRTSIRSLPSSLSEQLCIGFCGEKRATL
jgi:hypothetical protein